MPEQDRATTAKAELEAATGRRIFDIVLMDVADLGSVRAGLAAINGSIDALVMNAGVIGPKTSMDLTADGVTTVFATNVLGHVVLLEGLLAEDRLGEVAVFAGSEAVRGVPKLRMKGPSFVSTSADELATVIDGSYFDGKKADFNLAFGQAKYIGALWMAYLARQHPDRRFITVSPGNTTGTQAANDLPLPMRIAAKYVMPTLGLAHKLDVGAKRLVDGVTDPTLSSGVFYASAANTLKGPMVNQADFFPGLASPSFQDHANIAVFTATGIRLSELAGIRYDPDDWGAATSTCSAGDHRARQGPQDPDRQDRLRCRPQPRPLPARPRPARARTPAGAVARGQQPGAADRQRDLPGDRPPGPAVRGRPCTRTGSGTTSATPGSTAAAREGDLMELNGWSSPQMLAVRRQRPQRPRPPHLRPHHGGPP